MENKEKTHHHFVPQVYLRKFAHTVEKKGDKKIYFVAAFDKVENQSNEKIDVYALCAKRKLYLIESNEQKVRERMENFYGEKFENKYNDIYNLITDSSKSTITFDEREFLVSWIISLHFRNYFWLKTINNFSEKLIESFGENFNRNVYTEKDELMFDFETKSKTEILAKEKKENQQLFVRVHLEQMINLIKAHMADAIIVERISGNEIFITSDKPVLWPNYPNSIRIPFDSKHLITLQHHAQVPNVEKSNIERAPCLMKPALYNAFQYEGAQRHVIGYDLNNIHTARKEFEDFTISR